VSVVPFAPPPEPAPASKRAAGQRGFALLIVLWSLALLTLLGTRVTSAGRTEAQIARNLHDAAIAEAAADGAIHEAAFHLLDRSQQRWQADGQIRRLLGAGLVIDVRVQDTAGLLNPNSAPPALVAALIREVGGDPGSAPAIAAAIFDWRTPMQNPSPGGAKLPQYRAAGRAEGPSGQPFDDLDELSAVLGMTPALLTALRPHLSLYNFGQIDLARTTPQIARAMAASGFGQPALDDIGPIAVLRADVTLANGAGFTRRATLLLQPMLDGHPFQILSWDSGNG